MNLDFFFYILSKTLRVPRCDRRQPETRRRATHFAPARPRVPRKRQPCHRPNRGAAFAFGASMYARVARAVMRHYGHVSATRRDPCIYPRFNASVPFCAPHGRIPSFQCIYNLHPPNARHGLQRLAHVFALAPNERAGDVQSLQPASQH